MPNDEATENHGRCSAGPVDPVKKKRIFFLLSRVLWYIGKMRPFLRTAALVLFATFVLAFWVCASTGSVTLVTQEEAEREDAPAPDTAGFRTVCDGGRCFMVPGTFSVIETSQATGPRIRIVEPAPDTEYKAPIRLVIDFLPKEGAQVDLKSFKLEYLKLISIDITERVAGYVRPEGLRIEKADLPAGTHKLRLTLKDTAGGVTQQVYLVKIAR